MAPHSRGRDDERDRYPKVMSHRAMLSRALHRANMAVNLDNAQDFEAARSAYADACDLLLQVVQRTTGDEERRKLEAIRSTYTNRINELGQISFTNHADMKTDSPSVLASSHVQSETSSIPVQQNGDDDIVGTTGNLLEKSEHTLLTGPLNHQRHIMEVPNDTSKLPLMGEHLGGGSRRTQEDLVESESSVHKTFISATKTKIPLHPYEVPQNQIVKSNFASTISQTPSASNAVHTILTATGSTSSEFCLFNDIDSKRSSGQSMPPLEAHIEDAIIADSNSRTGFDAALDEAVDAAYDESYEPIYSVAHGVDAETVGSDIEVQTSLREARLANQQLRDARGGISHPSALSLVLHSTQATIESPCGDFYNDDSSEDGDKATQAGLAPHNDAPRNDANSAPDLTDHTRTTTILPELQITKNTGLDSLPNAETASDSLEISSPGNFSTVWGRRLSGQHIKQLKIETTAKFGTPNQIFFADAEYKDQSFGNDLGNSQNNLTFSSKVQDHVSLLSPRSATHEHVDQVHGEAQTSKTSNNDLASSHLDSSCHAPQRPVLRKEFSSSSLRSLRYRKMSIGLQDDPDLSPGTPSANPFIGSLNDSTPGFAPSDEHTLTNFSLGVRSASGFNSSLTRASSGHVGGSLHILDDNLHALNTPGSPNAAVPGAPAPLEACPTEIALRPFWLMRCIYQTLAHPCGGYISTRLFVPRDAWKVKGVKLKNVEDKIAGCDLLTAALLKLARVDPNDADAVLEEMQSFELVLDHVQANLVRRLGNEVGPHASGLVTSVASESDQTATMPRSSSVSSKSSSFSWKRLRSKNSAAGLGSNHAASRPLGPDAFSDVLAPATLPLSSNVFCRPPKRDFHQVQFSGPNASYMTSLAQLFDAAQSIETIARQVDDPGLRHVDKTQVGLELSTRRAAEFFGFYICRFVLSDLALLLDKFIKRGSEWVLV